MFFSFCIIQFQCGMFFKFLGKAITVFLHNGPKLFSGGNLAGKWTFWSPCRHNCLFASAVLTWDSLFQTVKSSVLPTSLTWPSFYNLIEWSSTVLVFGNKGPNCWCTLAKLHNEENLNYAVLHCYPSPCQEAAGSLLRCENSWSQTLNESTGRHSPCKWSSSRNINILAPCILI